MSTGTWVRDYLQRHGQFTSNLIAEENVSFPLATLEHILREGWSLTGPTL